jgi:hypothetical protein
VAAASADGVVLSVGSQDRIPYYSLVIKVQCAERDDPVKKVSMSYDIYLFKPDNGESADEAFERLFDESDDFSLSPASPQSEALKEKIAAALLTANPILERFQFDYAAVAKVLKTTEEEARIQWRHIELNGPEDGNGIQIEINDDKASITIPYWHEGFKAQSVFEEVWRYLEVFRTEADYLAYDPQLYRPLDLSDDRSEVVDRYSGVMSSIKAEITAAGATISGPSKPWWKFW